MNPKEKAKELYDKMLQWQTDGNIYIQRNITSTSAKYSALIAVDEIIKSQTCCDNFECKHEGSVILRWWGDVKREIEQL